MNAIRMIGYYSRQTVRRAFGIGFIISILLTALAFFLDTDIGAKNAVLGLYPPQEYDNVACNVTYVLVYGNNYKLYLSFITLGSAVFLPEDWKTGWIQQLIKRFGTWGFSVRQVVLGGINGGMAAAGGFGLYLLILRNKLPWISGEEYENMYEFLYGVPYYTELTPYAVKRTLLCVALIFFLAGMVCNAFVTGFSILLRSKYLVFVFPYLISNCYIEMAKFLLLPDTLRIDRWLGGMVQPFPISICIGLLFLFACLIEIISIVVLKYTIKWRLENG